MVVEFAGASTGTRSFNIARPGAGGFFDFIRVDASGIIRIVGWSSRDLAPADIPLLRLDGQTVPFLQIFHFRRPDVPLHRSHGFSYTGFALDYLVPESMLGPAAVLELALPDNTTARFESDFSFINPDYRPLFEMREVLHRDQIYSSGAPNALLNPETLELAAELEGPLLDFGCGRGVLISELRRRGIDAYGLELDTDLIRQSIPPELTNPITLYYGQFPSPFPDGRFRSVFCSEVLEHIPDFQAAIRDIARLATEKVIFTVPDASAIPIGFRHGAVPWHLLEATHLNFFNQQSLACALEPYFARIEFGRIGWSHFNSSEYYVSLVAVCWK